MKVNYQWHNAPKELPDCDCVCVTYNNGGYHVNVWNSYYKELIKNFRNYENFLSTRWLR